VARALSKLSPTAPETPSTSLGLSSPVDPDLEGVHRVLTVGLEGIDRVVAGVGTLFFTVADSHGFGTATVTAELTEAALAVVTAALAWTLPSARR
jgi:hypothetical protein